MHNFKIKTSQCFGEGKFYLKFNELNELDELYLNAFIGRPCLLASKSRKSKIQATSLLQIFRACYSDGTCWVIRNSITSTNCLLFVFIFKFSELVTELSMDGTVRTQCLNGETAVCRVRCWCSRRWFFFWTIHMSTSCQHCCNSVNGRSSFFSNFKTH